MSRSAVLHRLREWLRAGDTEVAPVMVITSVRPEDRAPSLEAATRIWRQVHSSAGRAPRETPWARLAGGRASADTAAGDEDEAEATVSGLLKAALDGSEEDADGVLRHGLLVVDDLDELPVRLARRVERAARNADRLAAAGIRLLIGAAPDPDGLPETDDPRTAVLLHRHVHPRQARLERIVRWASDPQTDEVLLVTGPPGSGKTLLLQQAVDVLESGSAADVAFALLRDPGEPNLATLTTHRLVQEVAQALDRRGITAAGPGAPAVDIRQEVQDAQGPVVGLYAQNLVLQGTAPTVDLLVAALRQQAGQPGGPGAPLVIVVDALNELSEEPQAELGGLRLLLAELEQRFQRDPGAPRLGVKVLLSSHDRPDWLRRASLLDLQGADTDLEIRDYAVARLAGGDGGRQHAEELAGQIVRLSGGLFIVASGLLDEWEETGRLPEPGSDTAAGNAASYFADRLERMRETALSSGDERRVRAWEDTERFLTLAGLVPQGLTADEFATLWAAPTSNGVDAPVYRGWKNGLPKEIAKGPARRFLLFPRDNDRRGRFRVLHPSIREAVLAERPRTPGATLADELDRFLSALTPLDGTGPQWDPRDGRLALACTAGVLTRLLDAALRPSPEPAEVARAERRIRRLLEDWRWLETCLGHADDTELPLGLGLVDRQLGEILALESFDAAALELWPDGPPELSGPPPAATTRPAAGGTTAGPAPPLPAPTPTTPGNDRGGNQQHRKPARKGTSRAYASIGHPTIKAVVTGSYRFPTREEAVEMLGTIKEYFVLSRKLNEQGTDPGRPALWITGFAVSPQEKRQGVRGHYARLGVDHIGGRWTLTATPVDTDLPPPVQPVPRRKPPHPNWGHPILRRVRRNQRETPPSPYATQAHAQRELDLLHEEYPAKSIPNPGLLYIMVYDGGRLAAGKVPVVKQILSIERCPGGFVIRARENRGPREAADIGGHDDVLPPGPRVDDGGEPTEAG
ncbi:AAA family ATPase [Streptomyces sp. JJ38]|uniref:AAA family ATPase n=1 Tax=Streptomyces sp. JJ38 TaxID=2738128 RepID=UPI001C55C226|nr:AAA family ATPase [Streptomyces sp. JJ38]MBW1596189.1 AAA family ATPase [Streptomyces sp. JJ38]